MSRILHYARRAAGVAKTRERWRTAALGYRVARRLDSSGAGRWSYGLGWALEQRGSWPAAERAYQRAIDHDPTQASWLYRLGWAREHVDDWLGAAKAYSAALEAPGEPHARMYYRLGWVSEQLGDLGEAQRHYETAISLRDELGGWHYRLGRVLERRNELDAAADAYEAAIARNTTYAAAWLGRIAGIRQRQQDLEGVAEAYTRAADAAPDDPTWLARSAVAFGRQARWAEAQHHIERNIERHPDDPRSYYLLARQCRQQLRWGGSLDAADGTTPQGRLDLRPSGVSMTELHDQAVRALERAVELRPTMATWRWRLGEAVDDRDGPAAALPHYEAALQLLDEANGRWVFQSRHPWQFGLEDAHARAGQQRVEDPLFACTATPTTEVSDAASEGVFEARFAYNGLKLVGLLFDPDVDRVGLYLDGQLVREVNVSTEMAVPRFSFSFKRSTLELFPATSRLTVRTPAGLLRTADGSDSIVLTVPHGTDKLPGLLEAGTTINKKGVLGATPDEIKARQLAYLETYGAVKEFFEEELGQPPFLLYGTLLGFYRDGRLIPSDDDFDAGYISKADEPKAVKEETKEIIVKLVRAGFVVSFNRRGRLFRLATQDSPPGIHIDIRPLWFQEGRAWVHNYASVACERADFEPFERGELRGTEVLVPRNAEVFIRAHYGPGWKVPDPGFRYYASEVDPLILNNLSKALITPQEARELGDRIAATAPTAVDRYQPIGLLDFYPLSDTVIS